MIIQLLEKATKTTSAEQSMDLLNTAYMLSGELNYDQGTLIALSQLIPLEIQQNNNGIALGYLLEKQGILEKRKASKSLLRVNTEIGDLFSRELLYQEAIPYYKKAEQLLVVAQKEEEEALYDKLGFNYANLLKADSAEYYYSKLLTLSNKDELHQLNTLRKLVEVFQQVNDYEKVLNYNLEIKTLLEASSKWKKELRFIYNNLGHNYHYKGNYEKAIEWFNLAEDYFKQDQSGLAILYTNLGVAHFNLGELKTAISYLLKASSLTGSNNYRDKGNISNILANIYLQNEDHFNAQNHNKDAIAFAILSKNTPLQSEVYETAAEIHTDLFEYEEAIAAYKLHLNFKDSLLLQTQLAKQSLLQQEVKLGKKEKEVRVLLINDQVKDLKIQKLESEQVQQQLAFDNLNLQAEKTANELEIREATLKNQELETKQTRQQLLLTQGRLSLQQKENELSRLAQKEALASATAERNKALLEQEAQRNALLEQEKEINTLELENQKTKTEAVQRNNIFLALIALFVLIGLIYTWRTNKKLGQQKLIIEEEQQKSERLLLNILPQSVAQELKEKGRAIPKKYESVSILFSDFVDFTRISARSTPEQILHELNECFMGFDAIMEEEGIEKIQTVGDGYLAVGGLPEELPGHAVKCVYAAKKMIAFLEERNKHNIIQWNARIGIHTGPITAGVIGTKKFAYSIFGDTVNTASRIETAGAQGRINVSASTFALIKDTFNCEYRGKISAKGKGDLDMYFVA